ncbi:hypothetical protein [uncultured Litoreibacter sp.]|uniref:hypothetical protein n=1 Tax=uncultured Litoreibacter sp. TaxID=1392394 RepID=UPI00262EEB61|nr:hypothetical protein [uncultured Litoreibacter sp.]
MMTRLAIFVSVALSLAACETEAQIGRNAVVVERYDALNDGEKLFVLGAVGDLAIGCRSLDFSTLFGRKDGPQRPNEKVAATAQAQRDFAAAERRFLAKHRFTEGQKLDPCVVGRKEMRDQTLIGQLLVAK